MSPVPYVVAGLEVEVEVEEHIVMEYYHDEA